MPLAVLEASQTIMTFRVHIGQHKHDSLPTDDCKIHKIKISKALIKIKRFVTF